MPQPTANPPCAAVATAGSAADLYPPAAAAAIDSWLSSAGVIEAAAAAWCQPTAAVANPEQRAAAKQQLEAALGQLEAALAGSSHLAGGAATIADVAVLASLLALYQEVLGRDVQQQYGAVTRWLQACAAQPQFAAVLGESAWRSVCDGSGEGAALLVASQAVVTMRWWGQRLPSEVQVDNVCDAIQPEPKSQLLARSAACQSARLPPHNHATHRPILPPRLAHTTSPADVTRC